MDTRLFIDNAMMIASGEYPERNLGLEFRAISVLQSHVMEMRKNDDEFTGRYPLSDIEDSLMKIVTRHSHSEPFQNCVTDARGRIIRFLSLSKGVMGDILYWDMLSEQERFRTCQLAMKEINVVFREHEHLPPIHAPIIKKVSDNTEKCYLDRKGNPHSYVPTVWATSNRNVDGIQEIKVNTYPAGNFDNPYHVIAALYGEYITLIHTDISRINNTFFRSSSGLYDHDIELLDTAQHESGFIDPYLDYIQGAQFTTSLVNAEKTAFMQDLKHVVEQEAPQIPAREKKSEIRENRLRAGLAMLGLRL